MSLNNDSACFYYVLFHLFSFNRDDLQTTASKCPLVKWSRGGPRRAAELAIICRFCPQLALKVTETYKRSREQGKETLWCWHILFRPKRFLIIKTFLKWRFYFWWQRVSWCTRPRRAPSTRNGNTPRTFRLHFLRCCFVRLRRSVVQTHGKLSAAIVSSVTAWFCCPHIYHILGNSWSSKVWQ